MRLSPWATMPAGSVTTVAGGDVRSTSMLNRNRPSGATSHNEPTPRLPTAARGCVHKVGDVEQTDDDKRTHRVSPDGNSALRTTQVAQVADGRFMSFGTRRVRCALSSQSAKLVAR
jgi:hypothetical protein